VSGTTITVSPLDSFRKRVYIAPAGLWLTLDAGTFQAVTFDSQTHALKVLLAPSDSYTPNARLRIEQPAKPAGIGTYSVTGTSHANCGPLYDDFETYGGWNTNPLGTDTATSGAWQRANPATTIRQLGTTVSGSEALVTGAKAGSTASSNDVDGGVTTVRSGRIALPATVGRLTFRYYLAHSSNATSLDYFRAYVERADGSRTLVLQELGAANTDRPAWASASISMTPWAGQTVRIVFAAADRGRASTIEAAVDDVRIRRP
jgi:hypothetical protein